MKNQKAWNRYPKVAQIAWLPAGTQVVQIEQFIFKPNPPIRIQLIVRSDADLMQYRATAFRRTRPYTRLVQLRKEGTLHVQLKVEHDRHGSHIVEVSPV